MARKIPSKNLPLINLDGLSDSVKLIIEKRLKGSPMKKRKNWISKKQWREASLTRSRKLPKSEPDWDREAEVETAMTTYEHGGEVG
jgi:hypothetical protein